jgi:hypothetical protein
MYYVSMYIQMYKHVFLNVWPAIESTVLTANTSYLAIKSSLPPPSLSLSLPLSLPLPHREYSWVCIILREGVSPQKHLLDLPLQCGRNVFPVTRNLSFYVYIIHTVAVLQRVIEELQQIIEHAARWKFCSPRLSKSGFGATSARTQTLQPSKI